MMGIYIVLSEISGFEEGLLRTCSGIYTSVAERCHIT